MEKVVSNLKSKISRLFEKLRQFISIEMDILKIQSTCFDFYFLRSNCQNSHRFLVIGSFWKSFKIFGPLIGKKNPAKFYLFKSYSQHLLFLYCIYQFGSWQKFGLKSCEVLTIFYRIQFSNVGNNRKRQNRQMKNFNL